MRPSSFCIAFFIAAFSAAAGIATFNYCVDPYLLFNLKRIPAFNDAKPAVETREWMMKAYQAERTAGRTVILGSSRSDIGLDPASHEWPISSQPVYNLSLIGADTGSNLAYLRHFVALHAIESPPQLVIVGLDFESFLSRPLPPEKQGSAIVNIAAEPSDTERRLVSDVQIRNNRTRMLQVFEDKALGLLSLDAVVDSVRTILGNRAGYSPDLAPNGHLSDAIMRRNVLLDGYAAVFDQKHMQTIQRFGTKEKFVLADGGKSLMPVHELLQFAKAKNIAVILFIQPSHVSRLELLDYLGYWPEYEQWKRDLTDLVESSRGNQKVSLWDFSGYDPILSESVPKKNNHGAKMKGFWDPVHYSTFLGDILIKRMVRGDASNDIGTELTHSNLDARLSRVRRDRQIFRESVPDEAARLARLACNERICGTTKGMSGTRAP